MTVENWGLEMEPTFHAEEGFNDELFEGNIWKDLPTPPRSPAGPVLDFEMENLPGDFPFPDLGYQGVTDVLTTLPVVEEHSARTSGAHQSKLTLKSEPLDSYFAKPEPMNVEFGKLGSISQPQVKPEPVNSVFVKNEPMDSFLVKNESVNSVFVKKEPTDSMFVKNEPTDSMFVKNEPMDSMFKNEPMDVFVKNEPVNSIFIESEPLDSVFTTQELVRDIESENFLDSITSYYQPKEEQNHLGPCSLPCDSDCEEDSIRSIGEEDSLRSIHKTEDVLNYDCMWNGLDDIKLAKSKSSDSDDNKYSGAYIPYSTNSAHRSNCSTPSPSSPRSDAKGIENTSLSDHCYYNNGLPTPSESDRDEEKRISSSEDESEDTVTLPNNQKEILRFINAADSQPVSQTFSKSISEALMQLRKSGKPINSTTIVQLDVRGRRFRLRLAPRKSKGARLQQAVVADSKTFSPPVNVSPLRNTNSRVTTVTVPRARRTTRKREATPPPVKPTPRRRKQNTVGGPKSRKRQRTSSGSESDVNEDICSGGKRMFHNSMERQRRIHLKESFDTLRFLVPSLQDRTKTPKVLTLRESASYCVELTYLENKLRLEKESLEARQKELLFRVKLLEDEKERSRR